MTTGQAWKLVTLNAATERLDNASEEIKLGEWYWLKVKNREGDGVTRKLTCVVHVGSNHAELETAGGGRFHSRSSWRVHFNEWDDLCEHEPDPNPYIRGKIDQHQQRVREIMGEIQRITVSLGIVERQALGEQALDSSAQALAAASSTANIEAHKQALILAKKETLPDLFKQIESEHEAMAVWMKAESLPAQAQLGLMKESVKSIDDRIFTVELYAGLVEKLEQIREGKPAPNDTKVSLFQRRHYMDEECLANYEAGGMDYSKIADFDRWLCKPQNLIRILPFPRSIVAFQVRRHRKDRDGVTLNDWIQILSEEKADKWTFLYIRNGEQVWRMYTEIEFQEQLFPDPDHEILLGAHTGDLWVRDTSSVSASDVITDADYQEQLAHYQAELAAYPAELRAWGQRRAAYKKALKAWKARSDEYRASHENERPYENERPWAPDEPRMDSYERVTPASVHYDDVMRLIGKMTAEHNRIATVLQGLLDRSPCLQPHPPWRIWTAEGFKMGIDLIYDDSRAITSGDVPDFEVYRAELNRSIKVGTLCVGQQDLWERAEAVKYNAAQDRTWRGRGRNWEPTHYTPHGNPGPGEIAKVVAIGRNGDCIFEWKRERLRAKSWRYGQNDSEDDSLTARFRCPASKLLNVSAYTPGDFKIFFADPRTRADYIQWAPFLLTAEDYYGGKKGRRK